MGLRHAVPIPDFTVKTVTCISCRDRLTRSPTMVCNKCRFETMPRYDYLVQVANEVLDIALAENAQAGYRITGIVGMFSGGNDSTTLAHIFKDRVTHYAHSNTQIGIEQTRQYVRDTCSRWDIPLLEHRPVEGQGYEDLVLGECKPLTDRAKFPVVWKGGFPGAPQHGMFFQRLKERQMDLVKTTLNIHPRYERVIFIGGRRSEESARRKARFGNKDIRFIETRGSAVWVSPLLWWTKLDINEYRRHNLDVPRNEVSDLLHMSGECLCGCYAHLNELDEIEMWYPGMAKYIQRLMWRVRRKNLDIPKKTLCWGWNASGKCATGLCNT